MKILRNSLLFLLVSLPFTQVIAAETYSFSFDNVLGPVPGTVKGTIELNFLTSSTDSGIGPASEIRITSALGSIPAPSQGPIVTDWTVQVQNRFEVVNGVIVDYEFGAAVGPASINENVFCLNNGPLFFFPSVWLCGQDENYYGDAFDFVYNTGGIGAVTFAHIEYTYQLVIPPGAEFANTYGINNAGKVTGGVYDPETNTLIFSFIYDMKSGDYTVISDEFAVIDISNPGVMVGQINGVCAISDKHGNITPLFPPSWTPASFCEARGVNPDGKVSGFLIDESDNWLGFIYDSEYGTYEEFLPSWQTIAHAINAQGQNVGSVALDADEAYTGSAPGRYGYLRQTDGSVKYFEISQSIPGQSRARGISENGLITGFYWASDTDEFKSYVTTLSQGNEFETITLADDEVVFQSPCNSDMPAPPGYILFTDMTTSQIRNDGVVVGSCVDYYFGEAPGDFTFYGYGFIATPIK